MKLYIIHNDPENICYHDERDWVAVVAPSETRAKELAVNHVEIDSQDYPVATDGMVCTESDIPKGVAATEHVVTGYEEMRLCGFRDECDSWPCEECELYSMGLDEYSLCSECYVCSSCGCRCESEA